MPGSTSASSTRRWRAHGIKRNPFHPFSSFDTATLAGAALGQTVLAKAVTLAGIEWDTASAHSAAYDAERTADLFCNVCNALQSCLRARRGSAHALSAGREAAPRTPADMDEEARPGGQALARDRLAQRARRLEQLLQLAVRYISMRDVAAADQLAVHVQLRIGGPVRVALQRLAQFRVLEDVDGVETRAQLRAARHGLRGKAALRKIRRALHEQHHRVPPTAAAGYVH